MDLFDLLFVAADLALATLALATATILALGAAVIVTAWGASELVRRARRH
jgi:hypothetical protein